MVGRPDSLQTAPNLHDRMWELDGFGDYMKHSFHFQFIVLRRGITFIQMAGNLEMHSFCESQNGHRRGRRGQKKSTSKTESILLFTRRKKMCYSAYNGSQLYTAQMELISVVSRLQATCHNLTMGFKRHFRDDRGVRYCQISNCY